MRGAFGKAAVAALLVASCGGEIARPATTATPRPSSSRRLGLSRSPAPVFVPRYTTAASYAVRARLPSVPVRAAPDGAVIHTLANPQPSGAPLVFLLKSERAGWLEVYLPVRPNGSTGWVRDADVAVEANPYRVDVERGAHRLRLYRDGALVREFPVGIGKENTPTPGGVFYIKELLVPTNGSFYGPYAYGLSGFSNVLTKFNGGEGVIGLHGTSQPQSVGKDASNGCIRMFNADITELARLLPLGTPVRILP